MQLDVKEQEQKFFSTQWNRNLPQEITSFFFKCAFDVLQVQSLICIQQGGQLSASVNITVGALHLMLAGFLTFGFYRARSRDISAVMLFHVLSYVARTRVATSFRSPCVATIRRHMHDFFVGEAAATEQNANYQLCSPLLIGQ